MATARYFVPFKQVTYNRMKILPLRPYSFENNISNIFLFLVFNSDDISSVFNRLMLTEFIYCFHEEKYSI